MALTINTMKDTIINAQDAAYGPPEDEGEQEKFATMLATALLEILTTQAVVTSTGATAVGTPGGPLPITNLPGGIS